MGESQLDKFNKRMAKVAKKVQDDQAIQEAKTKNKPAHYGETEGVEELMAEGNIKEAAAVFSREGINAFARMFSNSVETMFAGAIEKHMTSLEQRMEAVVEAKMLQMLEGMTEGMKNIARVPEAPTNIDMSEEVKKLFTEAVEPMVPKARVEDVILEPLEIDLDELKPIITPAPKPEDVIDRISKKIEENKAKKESSRGRKGERSELRNREPQDLDIDGLGLQRYEDTVRLGASKADIEVLEPIMVAILRKYEGEEVRSGDITRAMKDKLNVVIKNPRLAWQSIMKNYPQIENTSYGMYKYEEKTFHPTV